ncbi:ATP-binding protein [Nonomuraea wenchangensis]|uniref:Tetratricopeptide repeat-containing protein n=1 Tax=Nonomuraea wenchangensis TaxID=568860 RepID=A0A1I0HS10_9ACTN|nr:ATP-binding protein [Nonomuraea wenchangensis]SET86595.1 Tetratricopeptide repeat-containing protein [Nonomuraea wenchangensis]
MLEDAGLQALREAARLSPDNLPLRRHLGEQLLAKGHLAEAEAELRAALMLAPRDPDVTAVLAEAFVRRGAYGEALTALEPFLATPGYPPRLGVVAARALLGEGDFGRAAYRYYDAVTRDPAAADPEIASALALPAAPAASSPGPGPASPPAAPAPPAPSPAGPSAPSPAGRPAHSPAGPSASSPVGPSASSPSGPSGAAGEQWRHPGAGGQGDGAAEVERARATFADVAGMDAVKESLRVKLLLPLQQPELFAAYGKRAGGGVLLYGPPGAGKTHLARAAAGELGAAFINVGLADILDMYIGSSERNLRATFDLARRNRPCVLFFDEVDALAARRSDARNTHNRQIVNQFLAELDGVDQNANEGVLVLAATNAPWYIDVAFRRPGRFDQLVFVPPPDAGARAAILRILCRDKPLAELDFDAVARATEHMVGADLKGIVDRAVEVKLHESMRAGHPIPMTTMDLLAAAKAARPTAVREWMATARNYVLHSNESGAWDDLLPWVKAKW